MSPTIGMVSRGSFDGIKTLRELHEGSDRAVALVGGSVVDVMLQETLTLFMRKHDKITDGLFRPSQALGSFSTKIDLGLLLGIYSEAAHAELTLVRKIRNKFAHDLAVNDFEHDPIRGWTDALKFGERYILDSVDTDKAIDVKGKPYRDWDYWMAFAGRNELIKSRRGRFLLTISAMTNGLMSSKAPPQLDPEW